MSAQPWITCEACKHKRTQHVWVYVISRPDQPWSKVGTARRISARMATYRRDGISPEVEHRIETCCGFRAILIESAAHKRIEKKHARQQGDWFDASPSQSIALLNTAIRSADVRNYP